MSEPMAMAEKEVNSFLLEIARELSPLLTAESRAFLAGKCEEFYRRVDEAETAQFAAARSKCERFIRRAQAKDHRGEPQPPRKITYEVYLHPPQVLRRVEPDEQHPEPIVKCVFHPKAVLKGDPRRWFPPFSLWWEKPDSREDLPDEQGRLLRDVVVVTLIHDMVLARHSTPVFFTRERKCPGGNWWHENQFESLQRTWVFGYGKLPDVERIRGCLQDASRNVIGALPATELPEQPQAKTPDAGGQPVEQQSPQPAESPDDAGSGQTAKQEPAESPPGKALAPGATTDERRGNAGGDGPKSPDARWQSKVLVALLEHRDWTVERIAQHVGRRRQTLYKDRDIKAAIKARNRQKRAPDKSSCAPRGGRDPETGQIDAVDDRRW